MKVSDLLVIGSIGSLVLCNCDSTVSGRMGSPASALEDLSSGAVNVAGSSGAASNGAGGSASGLGGSAGSSGSGNTCPDITTSCIAASSSEPLPGRPIVSEPVTGTVAQERVTVGDIYDRFKASCEKSCHISGGSGDAWVPTLETFATDKTHIQDAINRISSERTDFVMPPLRPASQRKNPGVDRLLQMLEEWVEAGTLPEGYLREVPLEPGDLDQYRYTAKVRQAFSNIGNCIPTPELVGCANDGRAQELDQMFERITSFADLPKRLEDTDMISFDSAVLAPQGVLGFAPTYTLFSDHAKKMRHVRVPRGTSIQYDPAIQDFVIPPNTRFYKTFLKAVTDESGGHTYRKIETRIIISRPDKVEAGQAIPTAVFGSYLWSLDESRAELIEEPYNDGRPFKDTILEYVTDEKKAREELGASFDPNARDGVIAASQVVLEGPLANNRLTRHYAVPGSDRCVQCHMGSSNGSFILGFTPFHADRRSYGQGGTFDEPPSPEVDYGAHELNQLERFNSYGIVKGITPGQVKLEAPQDPYPPQADEAGSTLARTFRTREELVAQGYMMGNCAFCHNPRGFPTVENPVLKDKLNFFPHEGGGIFQFPLERSSPRTFRTTEGNIEFPYITPSRVERTGPNIADHAVNVYPSLGGSSNAEDIALVYIQAPWRSLIYRNVSTPFTYANDNALHPHMPLNVPGFDCRVPQIMAEWMLSIPARLKPGAIDRGEEILAQPWEEVFPADPAYASARAAAAKRLESYGEPEIVRTGVQGDTRVGALSRFHYCPDQSDILAPEMIRAVNPTLQPDNDPIFLAYDHPVFLDPIASNQGFPWDDIEPDRPHWLDRDVSSPQEEKYVPRRSDWQEALGDLTLFLPPQCPPVGVAPPGCIPDLTLNPSAESTVRTLFQPVLDQAQRVFDLQKDLVISDELRDFALRPFPFGAWATGNPTAAGEQARCERAVAASRKAKSFTGNSAPLWFSRKPPDPEALIYAPTPGEIMFTQICSNCHGSRADSQSLLANTILEMTGGRTRVANLRDGLFGEGGRRRADAEPEVRFASDDEAGRYVVWMGLGGTTAVIPSAVLNRVGNTRPLGVKRPAVPLIQATPNMLSNAVGFCEHAIGQGIEFDVTTGKGVAKFHEGARSSLVNENGDAELWMRLCALDNPGPIRAVTVKVEPTGGVSFKIGDAYWGRDDDGSSIVPADIVLGTERGTAERGLQLTNLFPWCFRIQSEDDQVKAQEKWGEGELPVCPPELFVNVAGEQVQNAFVGTQLTEAGRRWATRGAMNVGLSVFLYLDAKSRKDQSLPAFDACAVPETVN